MAISSEDAGLLLAELVAGESDDREPLVAVGLLQAFQPLVLGRQSALGGHVDHQEGLAPVVPEGRRLTLEGVH